MRLALLVLLSLSSTAFADDELSEHTAELVGDARDTLGVIVKFDDKTGWAMAVRAKPGADEKTFQLALPKDHGHYTVYVAPGRKAIAFVEIAHGSRTVSAKDRLAWTWSPDGTLVKTWTYGDVLTAKELASVKTSTSHATWTENQKVTAKGLELEVVGTKRTVVLGANGSTFR